MKRYDYGGCDECSFGQLEESPEGDWMDAGEVVALNRELTDRLNGMEHKLGAEKQARESAESRLRELRTAIETIKSIVSDGFLNHREKLEVIESRCDRVLCTEALAKSAES